MILYGHIYKNKDAAGHVTKAFLNIYTYFFGTEMYHEHVLNCLSPGIHMKIVYCCQTAKI